MGHSEQRESRQQVLETARRMNGLGINRGTSGNVSCRSDAGFLVTPSGMPYDACVPGDIVEVADDGRVIGSGRPSSEWRFHRDIYRHRPEANAVVHTHSTCATTLACMQRAIPAFHYMVAAAGGSDIRCADYATFGTQQLSDLALEALAGRRACLLAHHGVIAIGSALERALGLAVEVENLAQMYLGTLPFGEPPLLDREEMARVIELFANYGPQAAMPAMVDASAD